MKKTLPIVLLLFAFGLAPTAALAQDATPAPGDAEEAVVDTTTTETGGTTATMGTETDSAINAGHSAEYVLNEAADDETVTLRGQLTASLGDERYTFEDETGTVQVRIDDDLFSADSYTDGLEVELIGEVDKDRGEIVEVEVEVVTIN